MAEARQHPEANHGLRTTGYGQPKITDFGLAKKLDDGEGQTLSGAVLGTEQAAGKGKHIGPAADVYALGAILYKLLTGRAPFKGPTPTDTILQVIKDEPAPPSRLQSQTPRDLETICLKCLNKVPEKRYGTALALAEDLERWQAGKPILARPVGVIERSWRWCRRNPAVAAMSAVAALLLIAGTVVSSALAVWALGERDRAETNAANFQKQKIKADDARVLADDAKNKALGEKAKAQLNLMNSTLLRVGSQFELDPDGALVMLNNEDVFPLRERDAAWGFYHDYCQRKVRTLRCSASSVRWSPDGSTLAVVERSGRIRFWKKTTDQEHSLLKGSYPRVGQIAWSPDGKSLAASCGDASIRVWDIVTGLEKPPLKGLKKSARSLAWSPDGTSLVSFSGDETIRRWDVETGKELARCKGPKQYDSGSEVWSPDARTLATGGYIETAPGQREWLVQVWDTTGAKEMITLDRQKRGGVQSLAFTRDGNTLASMHHTSVIGIWDLSGGKQPRQLRNRLTTPLRCGTWSPDGRTLATTGWDRSIVLWNTASGQEQAVLKGHTNDVIAMSWSDDGSSLASASDDGTIKIWSMTLAQERAQLCGHLAHIQGVSWSPDSKAVASGAADHTVRLWDPVTGRARATLTGHSAAVTSVAWSPDGKTIASTGDKTVRLWDVASLKEIAALGNADSAYSGWSPAQSVSWSPDSSTLASVGFDPWIRLWNAQTHELRGTLKGHTAGIYEVAFSPDGKRLASGSSDGMVIVWDVATGRKHAVLKGHSSNVWALAWSPDSKRLASGGNDAYVMLWDAVAGAKITSLRGHTHYVRCLAWSHDGKTLASGGWDQTIKLWETATWQERATLRGPSDIIVSLDWSPDGRTLASGADRTVGLWNVDPRRRATDNPDPRPSPLVLMPGS